MSHQRCDSLIAEPSSRREHVRGRVLLPAQRAQRVDLREEAVRRALQRLDRLRARDVGRLREPPSAHEAERAERGHELRAVDEREALLRLERCGSSPARSSASRAGKPLAVEPRLPLADERQREMRERREVAARADRAARRHDRQHTAVEALEQQLDELGPRAGPPFASAFARSSIAARTISSGYGSPTPHAWLRRSRSWSSSVSSSGIDLRDEAAEAGVDAVGVLARAVRRAVDDRAGRVHRARAESASAACALDRDRPDVLDGQVLAGEPIAVPGVTARV